MKQTIRVFGDTNSIADPAEFAVMEERLFSAIAQRLGPRAVVGDGYIEIDGALTEDTDLIQAASEDIGMGFRCAIEHSYTQSELKRALFVRLGIEGEAIDLDADGRPLNEYPQLLCRACLMPNERVLPDPYRISYSEVHNVKRNYWGEGTLSPNREVFTGQCGVVIVNSRVKSLLEDVLGDVFVDAPAKFENGGARGAGEFWAIRPTVAWGTMEGRTELATCSLCGRATEARLIPRGACQSVIGRVDLVADRLPEADFVCSDGWFGDRRDEPFGFLREIYISGRLYAILSQVGVRGLIPPSDVVWRSGQAPMRELKEAADWVKTHLGRLSLG